MPSIADSKKLVNESIGASDAEHDAILASLRNEIDRHNHDRSARRHSHKHRLSEHHDDNEDPYDRTASALRFRFKHDKHRSLKDRQKRRHRKHVQSSLRESPEKQEEDPDTTHPFPREPTSPTAEPSDDAFLSSLLDALADDEAASYWESVYSQPIHTYERPYMQTEDGGISSMTDDEYAAWVKRKMWEKNNPEVVAERDRMEAQRREEEELKTKRKEEFVRKRQREAWTHASRARSPDEHDYVFDFASTNSSARSEHKNNTARWQHAWHAYLQAWEDLRAFNVKAHVGDVAKLIPWPVLPAKPPTRPHIEEFLQHMPRPDAETRRRLLKVERVRWHPDKIQHFFAGRVDEGTMKVVTGIFQTIDSLWNQESDKQ